MPYVKGKHRNQLMSAKASELLKKLSVFYNRTMQGHVEYLIEEDAKKVGIE